MMMTIDHGDDQDDDDIEDDDDNDNDDDDDNHNNDDDEDGNGDYDDNDDDNDDASKFYIYIPWVFSKVNCVFIRLLNVKALICAFNKNKALIGAYSLIVKSLRTFVSSSTDFGDYRLQVVNYQLLTTKAESYSKSPLRHRPGL